MSKSNLYQKLHAIMAELGYLRKDKTNPHHKYNYLSEERIKRAIHPLLVKHKVLFYVSATHQEIDQSFKTPLTMASFQFAFVDIETGDVLEGTAIGQGSDSQDKGAYKAWTGAIKYILTSTFLIPTGDDPESENGNNGKVEKTITAGQWKKIQARRKELGWTDKAFKQHIEDLGYSAGSKIPRDKYDEIFGGLGAGVNLTQDDLPDINKKATEGKQG